MSWKTVNVTGNLLLSPPDDKHTWSVVHSTAFLDPPCNGKVACKLLKTATNSLKQLAERQKEQQLANDEVSELPVNFSTKLQLIWFQGIISLSDIFSRHINLKLEPMVYSLICYMIIKI